MDKTNNPKNGFGITSFVLSLVGFFGFMMPYISIFFSIAAIVFASLQKKNNGTGLATAGLVLGILGVIGNLIWLIIVGGVLALSTL